MLAARRTAIASARRAQPVRQMATAATAEQRSEIMKIVMRGVPTAAPTKPVAPSNKPAPQNVQNYSADLKAAIDHYYHETKTPFTKDNNMGRFVKLSMIINDVGADKTHADLLKISNVVTAISRREPGQEDKSVQELAAVFKEVDPRVADFFKSEVVRKPFEPVDYFPEDTEPGSVIPVPSAVSLSINAETLQAKHIRGDGMLSAFVYRLRDDRFRSAVVFILGAMAVGLAFEMAAAGYHPVPYDVIENYKVVDRKENEFLMSGGAVRYADIK